MSETKGYVYMMYNTDEEDARPVYIGKTIDLEKRIYNHFFVRNNGKMHETQYNRIKTIRYIELPTEEEACNLEANMIATFQPIYNTYTPKPELDKRVVRLSDYMVKTYEGEIRRERENMSEKTFAEHLYGCNFVEKLKYKNAINVYLLHYERKKKALWFGKEMKRFFTKELSELRKDYLNVGVYSRKEKTLFKALLKHSKIPCCSVEESKLVDELTNEDKETLLKAGICETDIERGFVEMNKGTLDKWRIDRFFQNIRKREEFRDAVDDYRWWNHEIKNPFFAIVSNGHILKTSEEFSPLKTMMKENSKIVYVYKNHIETILTCTTEEYEMTQKEAA